MPVLTGRGAPPPRDAEGGIVQPEGRRSMSMGVEDVVTAAHH